MLAAAQFPGVAYRDYSRVLPDYLRGLAARAYSRRNAEIEKLTTPEAVRRRQSWTRDAFWKLAGGKPERTPLNVKITGQFDRQGYRVEKLIYESRPEMHIPGNLYVPSGRGPFPGVLFQMGHSLNGKAYDSYQRCCQGLAKLGFVVLAFDPMGQGERVYYPDGRLGRTRLASSDDEHTLPGKQLLLLGDTSTRLQTWDAVRSLDVLASHPSVDPKRLASTGQSGGGTLTMLLAAVDDRLAAAAVCCGNTENFACARFNSPGSTDDAEQNLLGSGPLGLDRWDLLYPIAPKPLLVTVSDKDFFGTYSPEYISNGWEEFGKLKRVYETLGAGEKLEWAGTPLPHGLAYDTRMQVYNWFTRWLKGSAQPVTVEPPVTPEPDANTWATDSGNVVKSLRGHTPFAINRTRAMKFTPTPLDRLLGVQHPPAALRVMTLKQVPSRGTDIEAIEIASAPGVFLPSWLFLPKKAQPVTSVLLALEPGGRNVRWHEGEMYQTLAAQGIAVSVLDLRGIGDLAPEYGRGSPRHARSHNEEEDYAWASLILGRPLLGQRVTDVLAAAQALKNRFGRSVALAAQGKLTVPALFAAALAPAGTIGPVYLSEGLSSFRNIVDSEEFTHPFANFVPSLLNHTDLPEVAVSAAPRRITLAGPVDASGRPADLELARKLYERASNVRVEPRARWDAESLSPAAASR